MKNFCGFSWKGGERPTQFDVGCRELFPKRVTSTRISSRFLFGNHILLLAILAHLSIADSFTRLLFTGVIKCRGKGESRTVRGVTCLHIVYVVTPQRVRRDYGTVTPILSREVMLGKRRYEVGVEKLLSAEGEVSVMQASLEALQPQLVVAAANVAKTLKEVEKESAEAATVEQTVMDDEISANIQVSFGVEVGDSVRILYRPNE